MKHNIVRDIVFMMIALIIISCTYYVSQLATTMGEVHDQRITTIEEVSVNS